MARMDYYIYLGGPGMHSGEDHHPSPYEFALRATHSFTFRVFLLYILSQFYTRHACLISLRPIDGLGACWSCERVAQQTGHASTARECRQGDVSDGLGRILQIRVSS
jgi:hypothetical protein